MGVFRALGSPFTVLAVVTALLAGGCGGNDASADGDGQPPATTAAAPSPTEPPAGGTPDTTARSDSEGGPDGLAPGTGRITIEGTTWEAVADIQCLDFGVALGIQGHAVDDPSIIILLDANTDDPTANSFFCG